jgi:hypothetical protein
MFNILIDALPTQWQGFLIKTDFRQVLKFFKLIKDKRFNEKEKSLIILKLFFEEVPDSAEVWDFIKWYINLGQDDNQEQEQGNEKKVFDFGADHGRIYSAFLQVYNIDLTNVNLHWWAFMQLLESIPDNTKLMSVIKIRQEKIKPNQDKEYARQLRKLKNMYRIEQETQPDLFGFLKG